MKKTVFLVILITLSTLNNIQAQPGELEIDCSGISSELLKGTSLLDALYEACPDYSNNFSRKAADKGSLKINVTTYVDGIKDMVPDFTYKSSPYVNYRSRTGAKSATISPGEHTLQIYCYIVNTQNSFMVKKNIFVTGDLPESTVSWFSKGELLFENYKSSLFSKRKRGKKTYVYLFDVSSTSKQIYIESGKKTKIKVFLNNDLEFSYQIVQ